MLQNEIMNKVNKIQVSGRKKPKLAYVFSSIAVARERRGRKAFGEENSAKVDT